MLHPIIALAIFKHDWTVYISDAGIQCFVHEKVQEKEEERSLKGRATYPTTSFRTLRKEETSMDSDTAVKNEKNEYFHFSCADHDETLIILKKSEIGEGDVCTECKNELEYIDPEEEED